MQKVDPELFGEYITPESRLLKSVKTEWTAKNGETFVFQMALTKHYEISSVKNIYAFATKGKEGDQPAKKLKTSEESVGRVEGTLIRRCYNGFFEDADAVSQGLQEVSCTFFDGTGKNCRVKHEKLEKLGKKGLLFVDEIETAQSGLDLALHLLHAVLVFLKEETELVVIPADALNDSYCQYAKNKERAEKHRQADRLERARTRQASGDKIQRHFARMGFSQTPSSESSFWFLTMKEYFSKARDVSHIPAHWISKEEATKIQIASTVEGPRSSLDEELHNAINTAVRASPTAVPMLRGFATGMDNPLVDDADEPGGFPNVSLSLICTLVKKGASIDKAQGIHVAAANWKTPSLFHLLTALGGDVNAPDFRGSRPLHVAAATGNIKAVKILLQCGADKSLKDNKGNTARDELDAISQSIDDFSLAMGLNSHPIFEAKRDAENAQRNELKRLLG